MAAIKVGSKDCPLDELMDVFKSCMTLVIIEWEAFATCFDYPFTIQIQQNNNERFKSIKAVLEYWIAQNSDKANLGTMLSIIENKLEWKILTDSLRKKIQIHAKTYDDLDEGSKELLLNFQFIFLGRTTSLQSLKGLVSKETFVKILNAIDNNFIVGTLQKNQTTFDNFQLPPVSPNYTNRTIEQKRKLNPKILHKPCDDIFIFEPELAEGVKLSNLVKPNVADVSGAQVHSLTVRFILLEEEDHFEQILKKTESPVHRIKYHGNSYIWIRTVGSISVIREFLSGEVEEINEEILICNAISDLSLKPQAICGETGTGKSAFLANLANKIFQNFSERFVIFLNFPNAVQQHNFLGIGRESKGKTNWQVELFGSTFKMGKLARIILKGLMTNMKTRFEVFLDRFDEIPEEVGLFVRAKKILKLLHNCPNIRTYVTFGPKVRKELENHLQVISYDILPFRKHEIEIFLSTTVDSQVCRLVLGSIEAISKNEDLHEETVGSPLHCSMLVELYSYMTQNKTNLFTDIRIVKSLPELYKNYMDAKFKEMENGNPQLLKLLHYKDALHKIFHGNIHANSVVQALEEHIEKIPLPKQPFKSMLKHKTFSEFLIAQFIVDCWKNGSRIVDETTLTKFIYENLLTTCRKNESGGLPETFGDPEYDTFGSVLSRMETKKSVLNDAALIRLTELGWNQTLENLQTSILQGQLVFRHFTICFFLNDLLSNEESFTLGTYKPDALTIWPDSLQNFGWISKDFLSKVLVSLGCSHKYLFQLTTKLFRETTGQTESYIDFKTCLTILVLAVRQDDMDTFTYFRKLVEENRINGISSIRFPCETLRNMVYEHTPLHEAGKMGNFKFFEHLFKVYKHKLHSMPGLVRICLSDSSTNCDDVIQNKIKILRLLNSKGIKYDFRNVKDSFLDGIHVTLFTKVCDMTGYTLNEKDVKYLYKYVVSYFTKIEHMDILVNWLISKDLARFLLYSYEPKTFLLKDSLRLNILGPQSLKTIYNAQSFDFGSIIYFVNKCKNRQALMKIMVDLIGDVTLDDPTDPTIVQWATSMFDDDPMNYVSFDSADRANINERMANHKTTYVQKHADEIRKIVKESQSITDSGQIQYNSNDIIGVGAFSIVYRGTLNHRPVAVKKIYYRAGNENRVARETKILLEFDGHENILKCFYVQKSAHAILIALEICKFTLKQYVTGEKGLDNSKEAAVQQILYQITKGLDYLHSNEVVHLGITPGNILLSPTTENGFRVKITGFGNSQKLGSDKMKNEVSHATIEWMAPEVIKMRSDQNDPTIHKLSTKADIFSLGCLFYYVLSNGEHPFASNGTETKKNIENNNPSFKTSNLKQVLFIYLFYLMTNQSPEKRPPAAALLKHHVFWSEKTWLGFLVAVGNAASQPTVTSKISEIMLKVENYPLLKPYYEPINSKGWIRFLCKDVQLYVSGIGCKRKPYHGDLLFDLVRAIRNMQAHKQELPENVQAAVGAVPTSFMNYWLNRFAIMFEIIWLNFEDLKNDASSSLLEYYSEDFDFRCDEILERSNKILAKYVRNQCVKIIFSKNT